MSSQGTNHVPKKELVKCKCLCNTMTASKRCANSPKIKLNQNSLCIHIPDVAEPRDTPPPLFCAKPMSQEAKTPS